MSTHTINFDIAEPVVEDVWDPANRCYVTRVTYPHRRWTISVIPSGHNFAGDLYVSSDRGDDLGEFETFDRAMRAIRNREEY